MTADELISNISSKLKVSKAIVRRLLAEFAHIALDDLKTGGTLAVLRAGDFMLSQPSVKAKQTKVKISVKKKTFKKSARPSKRRYGSTGGGLISSPLPGSTQLFDLAYMGGDGSAEGGSVDSNGGGSADSNGGGSADSNGGGAGPEHRDVAFGGSKRILEDHKDAAKANYSVVRIFYATDREPASPDPLSYGARRSASGELHLGTCDVSIPRDHRMGEIERPSVLKLEFKEKVDKHFVIKEITLKTEAEFYGELAKRVEESEKKEAFVFIHGFKVAFEDAVYRTAQMAYDLGFPGAPILYSWPSNGKVYEYVGDINNNDWSVLHLKTFLEELAANSGALTVHLIAHSMGNRALLNALRLIAGGTAKAPHFRQIILTAPDIDADLFLQIAKAIQGTADRITLYVSKKDKALAASKKLNASYPRAGDCSRLVVVTSGVDTIDASAVDTNLVGHFYYAENRSVLSDIFNLLRDGGAPPRFGIRPVDGPPSYWRFVP
jgi:esterase/lipase superfamily enzyme